MCEPASHDVNDTYDTANKADNHLPVNADVQVLPFTNLLSGAGLLIMIEEGTGSNQSARLNLLLGQVPPVPF